MTPDHPILVVEGVGKSFTLHLRDGATIGIVADVGFGVGPGECVVLGGRSGAGKSSILKMIYGNYRASAGRILVLRRDTMSYVSQFLRVIPRVSTLDIVAAAARETGLDAEAARQRAAGLLTQLNLPERLWSLPPATFSGGEQQRVNIARGFAPDRPLLLLDEPTASLDAANRAVVVEMIREKKQRGVAVLGIFHDDDVRETVADRIIDVTRFASPAESARHDRTDQLPHRQRHAGAA